MNRQQNIKFSIEIIKQLMSNDKKKTQQVPTVMSKTVINFNLTYSNRSNLIHYNERNIRNLFTHYVIV